VTFSPGGSGELKGVLRVQVSDGQEDVVCVFLSLVPSLVIDLY